MRFLNLKIFAINLILCFNLFALVYEDIPKGVDFKFLNQVDLIVNGNDAKGKVFYSKDSSKEILNFYKERFKKDGYKEIQSKMFNDKYGMASFEKGILKNTIQVLPQKEGNIVLRYEIEEKVKNKEKELKDVPKPIGGITELCIERVSGEEKSITLFYKIKDSKYGLENFYINGMRKFGWAFLPNKEKEEDISLVFTKLNNWCLINITNGYVVVMYYYS
ncbi:MAG: hypothetical protein ABH873_07895 [Candidatus Firestonebacteria bacterium]